MFEWYVVCGGSKNMHQKDMCLEDNGLHLQSCIKYWSTLDYEHNWGGPMYSFQESTNMHFQLSLLN